MSEIAHQINNKLNQSNGDINSNVAHQQSNESVDLDNLFAFLSEVTPNSNNSNSNNSNSNNSSSTVSINNNTSSIIDDIEETFHDLDVELENVLQHEMEVLAIENERSNSNKCPPNAKMGIPSLPEPTTRPPPPPNSLQNAASVKSNSSTMGLNITDLSTEVIPLNKPPQIPISVKTTKHTSRKEEPIYEAVIPRHELAPVAEIPEPIINNSLDNVQQKLR